MNSSLARGLFLGWCALALPVAAQPYGLASRPAVGPFLNRLMPEAAPTLSGNWSTVVAFTNLTFTNAVGLTHVPGTTRLIVWEREGRIYSFENHPATSTKTLVLNIANQCQGWDDSGLLGVAFHPGFATNRYVFVWYNWVTPGTVLGNANSRPPTFTPNRDRLSRFTLDAGGAAIPGSETVFIDQTAESVWHNGGGMFFHPDNGFLYITDGDDAVGSNNQIIDRNLFSGVIRIDVDRRGGSISHAPPRQPANGVTANYFIPNDNPFVGRPNAMEELFCIGLRSPHRMTIDPVTGRIFIGDVGAGSREEISIIEPGESGLNFQWDRIEGLGGDLTPPYIGINRRPVIDYSHSEGFAVIGGYVYRGSEFAADLGGKYIFGDNGSKRVWILNEGTVPATKTLLATMPAGSGPNSGNDYVGLSSFGLDANGEIYLCQMSSIGGRIYKLQRGGPTNVPLPRLLSQTGAFTNVTGLAAAPGLIPYDVASPLWSDGAVKSRWMAIPTNTQISFVSTGEWTFPQGSVFVKHFELPVNDTNPAIRKRLETRLLVRETNGYVYGATYKWRADNTDAELLDGALTENISITTAPVGAFTGQDIGSPLAGSTTPFAGGYQIVGSGADIWGTADQFQFAWQQRTGDFDLRTRVESFTQADLYTKAGLMARESLAANSRHVYALVFPSNAARNNNVGGYEFQYRAGAGGNSVAIYPPQPQPLVSYPNTWLRLQREGDTFTAYAGSDGVNWTAFATYTLDLPDTVYFGFAVTAHNASTAATARFHISNMRLQQWYYPSRQDCLNCHTPQSGGVLGVKTRQSNRDFTYPLSGVTDNQVRAWNHVGLFNPPVNENALSNYARLVAVTNTSVSVETRVRSYLDANCAHCHRPGGVQAFWDGRYDTPLDQQGILNGLVQNTLGISGARNVSPGSVAKSIMHRRVNSVDPAIKMPPLARNVIDADAVAALAEWIGSLPPDQGTQILIAQGSDWKYLDDGSNQGTAWRAPGFNDSAWLSGPAQLGYGDGDEATVVEGGPSGNRFITTYFRQNFAVTNATAYTNFSVRLLRDDGAVGHLNGVEFFRHNMPTGAVNSATLAAGTVGDPDEDAFFDVPIATASLNEGTNVLAVEIHQVLASSSDISFDLELTGFRRPPSTNNAPPQVSLTGPPDGTRLSAPVNVTLAAHAVDFEGSVSKVEFFANAVKLGEDLASPFSFAWINVPSGAHVLAAVATDNGGLSATSVVVSLLITATNELPRVTLVSPASNAVFSIPATINLAATATDADGAVARVDFFAGATKLGESAAAPYGLTWSNAPVGSHTLTAVAVDNHGAVSVSAPVPVTVAFAPVVFTNTLVANGSIWRYLDDGSDQGAAWLAPGFNDSTWAFGPGQLGFSGNPAENDEATTINGGPAADRFITFYFRHRFGVSGSGSYTGLTVRLLRDDGGIVHLNGSEVFRSNLPQGSIDYLTRATNAVTGAGETTLFFTGNVPPGLLVEGTNVLAVEIHQVNETSSDVSFDLELTGRGIQSDPPMRLHAEAIAAGQFRFWFQTTPGRSYVIERSADLQTWTADSTNVAPAAVLEFIETNLAPGWRFYRVRRGD